MPVLTREPRVAATPRLPAEGVDAVSAYLSEIGRTALLTPEEEVRLGVAIAAGRDDSCSEAVRQQAQAAIRRLVESNLRLVPGIARHFLNRGLDLGDLIQEGNLGLIHAAEKFDYQRGFRFSTYAVWWIRQSIGRALEDRGRPIRLPVHVATELRRVLNLRARLQQQLGREPSPSEVGELAELPAARVTQLLELLARPASLDARLEDEDGLSLADRIADAGADDPVQSAETGETRAQIERALSSLGERERQVLELRYGLAGDNFRTLAEVGELLGVSRERVRQFELRAISKLRFRTREIRLASLV
jgi:RNA polymerase primary sigma factor